MFAFIFAALALPTIGLAIGIAAVLKSNSAHRKHRETWGRRAKRSTTAAEKKYCGNVARRGALILVSGV